MSFASQSIERAWKREGVSGRLLHILLRPASAVFAIAVRLRALVYWLHLRRRRRIPAAVVSVGNLSVGGTGKTPTALWLAEMLRARGYVVAILSRGYSGSARRATVVGDAPRPGVPASLDVRVVGDENVVLARRFAGPVVIAPRRAEAGALACREFGIDVAVLDDGFQHLSLRRDFDLVCLRPSTAGDDAVLPAGRLRESPAALSRAHAVLVTDGGTEPLDERLERRLRKIPVFRGEVRAGGLITPDPGGWRRLPMGVLAARKALALVGLADPQPFYRTLDEWDAHVEDFLEFPDHHVYTLDDWKMIAHRSRGLDLIVTTEKDLVKLEQFPFAKDKLVAVRVSMHVFDDDALIGQVVEAVEKRRAELAARGGRKRS